jgi:hypothetical protein
VTASTSPPSSPATAVRGDRSRTLAVAATALAQVASAPLTTVLLGPGAATGTISDRYQSLLTPAGYAFAIWGLIYAGCLALAAYQATPGQRSRAGHRTTGWWLALGFACSAAWVPVFGLGLPLVAQLIIVVLVGALAVALARLDGLPAGDWSERLLLRLPVAVYLGWASLATVASFGTTGRFLGLPRDEPWVTAAAVGALLLASGVVLAVGRRAHGVGGFVAAAAWALVAVAVGTPAGPVRVVALAGTAAILLALAARLRRTRSATRVAFG